MDKSSAQSGIYRIVHNETGRAYIGSAKDIQNRWKRHIYLLNKGHHHNPHLQAAWNKYGPDAFRFEVIEIVEGRDNLIIREQYYIDTRLAENGSYEFNAAPKAEAPYRDKLTLEHIAKMSKALKGKKRTQALRDAARQWRIGTTASEETKMKLSIAHRGKKQSPESIAKQLATKRSQPRKLPSEKRVAAAKQNLAKAQLVCQTPEAREKRAAAIRGRIVPPEVGDKISAAKMGHTVSEETRAKIRASLKATRERKKQSLPTQGTFF